MFHARTKHVEVDFHFVREKVLQKQLVVKYIPSTLQIADVFTKPLTISRFQWLASKLRLSILPASVCGGVLSTAAASAIEAVKPSEVSSSQKSASAPQLH